MPLINVVAAIAIECSKTVIGRAVASMSTYELVEENHLIYLCSMKTATAPPPRALLPSTRQVGIVLILSLAMAIITNPVFDVAPFGIVLGRTTFIAMLMLLAYTVSGSWRIPWVPRWLVQLLSVCLLAPVSSLIAYVVIAGNFITFIQTSNLLLGFVLSTSFALSVGIIMIIVSIKSEEKQRERADRLQTALQKSALEHEVMDARLRLLQAQIEPHFLFNTLANVQALVESGSQNAAPVLRHLVTYLHAAMPRLNDVDATLENEMRLVTDYLEIMRMRMPDRLQFALNLSPDLYHLHFPAMVLLTLVENAVRHGIDPSAEGGYIEMGGRRDDASGMIQLWVLDTGVGMAETALPGTGLANVNARMHAYFGADARVDLHEQAPHGLCVQLHFQSGDKT
jgi:sensor histidine kinase YesM